MERLAETLLREAHQIFERIRREAVRLGIRAAKNDRRESGLFIRLQPGRPALAPAVAQAFDPMCIVADDPIPQRLAVHSRRLGGRLPVQAGKCIGNRQKPRHARIALGQSQVAEHSGCPVLAYRKATITGLPPNQRKHCTTDLTRWNPQ